MKEITTILTVKITAIEKMTDDRAAEFELQRNENIGNFLEHLQKAYDLDDIQLTDSKIFIRDIEGGADEQ